MARKPPGAGANTSRVIKLLRRADTAAITTTGIGGVRKTGKYMPKPITLPKLKILETEPDQDD